MKLDAIALVRPSDRDQVKVIENSGNHLLRLIDDILAYSRGEAKPIVLDPRPLSLARLAEHLSTTYQPIADRTNNRFAVKVETGSVDWVKADEARLTQILRNLLDNAFKFTADGRIGLRIGVAKASTSEPSLRSDECLIRFSVSDTGIGIPASKADAIFKPFQRLERHRSLPGVGLGLAIAQQLATAMGGRIELESRAGQDAGTTFSVQLRFRTSAPGETECDEAAMIAGYRGPRRTLLIADDQPTHRDSLAARCRNWGFTVLVAGDGVEALKRFRSEPTRVDAILVDQFMPKLDGWGLLQAVRASEHGRDVKAVLISAAPMQRPDRLPEDVTFDRFAMKPLSEAELASILDDCLALDWQYETESSTDQTAAPEPEALCSCLFAEERRQLQEMVGIGQVLGIQQWAHDMANQQPERAAVWQGIEQMCLALDLPALKRLAAEATTD